ncbi:uncharacterized protein KY384_004231 [Bacidia gigantensis]|uniref:uncharacterized protein n=1 Tax=Bacidia gigantensis TaxID=2732470 RepID=UPI001D046AD1|nr:uncharacterized protein KY384_004231 [Bacidia gigantensis]KAG8530874.1 hypothetical protein KY384_004231 [Bacidia gigantensis]
MSQSMKPSPNGMRFYATLHRYVTSTECSQHRSSRPSIARRRAPCSHSSSSRQYASAAADITPPSSSNARTHYSLFPKTLPHGAPPHGPFAVDNAALRKEFLQLQSAYHPDKHSGTDKRKAEGTSALINGAYKTLQDPLTRAQYLLSLRGFDIADDERAKTEDLDLLEDVMEIRSLIEGAEEETELAETRQLNEKSIEESIEVLDDAFRRDDIEEAKLQAVKLRYWTNIKESLDSWEKGKPVILVH